MAARIAFIAIVISALISAYFLGYFNPMDKHIIKSPSDQREYKTYTLENGLKVLLISDNKTDKSAASLDVHVGSTSDPVEYPGLAHFLEHMLFLGTEAYPTAGDYQKFISKHGGTHNAYTSPEHTNYFFEIDNDYLEPALDRFSPFFISPLFDQDYVDREKNAVHSEYQSKLQDDGRRNYYVMKAAFNPEHPYSRFATGSLDTLSDSDNQNIRDVLLTFYDKHYSANIMTLTVLGKEPLETLETWVNERFKHIPNQNAQPLHPQVPLFAANSLPMDIQVKPVKNQKLLRLFFPLPSIRAYQETKPSQYIGHFIGHEGKGSLLSLLKSKGWAEALGAGISVDSPDSSVFSVSISLTENGLNYIDDMTKLVFEYIHLLKSEGLQESYYQEQSQLSQIQFQFQEPSSPAQYVSRLAAQMHQYQPEDYLQGPYLMKGFEAETIQNLLSYFRPDNLLRIVIKPEAQTDKEETWFKAPYAESSIKEDLIKQWTTTDISPELGLPPSNPFVPEDLTLKSDTRSDSVSTPSTLIDNPGLTLWHVQDDYFLVPKSSVYLSIRSPLATESVDNTMKAQLLVDLINDQLNEYSYPAYLAGLSYQLYRHGRGMTLKIDGYNDKQSTLLDTVLNTIDGFQAQEARFAIYKQELLRRLENAKKDKPYSRTIDELGRLLISNSYSLDQQIAATESLNLEHINQFSKHFLDNTRLVMLVHGNTTAEEAKHIGEKVQQHIQHNRSVQDVERPQLVKLKAEDNLSKHFISQHNDSALTLYIQGPDKSLKTRAYYGLISQMVSAPFYSQVRTEKQLGYIVFGTAYPMLEVPGIAFIVQSPNYSESDILQAIDDFLTTYPETLNKMSIKEFEQHQEGLVTRLLETPKNLGTYSKRLWNDIDLVTPDFDTRKKIADLVSAITLEEMQAFYPQALLSDTTPRLQIRTLKSAEHSQQLPDPTLPEQAPAIDGTTTTSSSEESENTPSNTDVTTEQNLEAPAAETENSEEILVIRNKQDVLKDRELFPAD